MKVDRRREKSKLNQSTPPLPGANIDMQSDNSAFSTRMKSQDYDNKVKWTFEIIETKQYHTTYKGKVSR